LLFGSSSNILVVSEAASQASFLLVDIVVGGCLERIRLSEFTCLEGFLDSNYMIVR
jgi:hypothetical protein